MVRASTLGLGILLLSLVVGEVFADYCPTPYPCTQTCYKIVTIRRWWRKSTTSMRSFPCPGTCINTKACCKGYTGIQCNIQKA